MRKVRNVRKYDVVYVSVFNYVLPEPHLLRKQMMSLRKRHIAGNVNAVKQFNI